MLRALYRPGVVARRPWLRVALFVLFALLIGTYAIGLALRSDSHLQSKDVPAIGLFPLMFVFLYTKRALWSFVAIELFWIVSIAFYADQVIRVLAMGPCLPAYALLGWVGTADEFVKEGFVCPTAISAALWMTTPLFIVELRSVLRSPLHMCEKCGYDMRANPDGMCSECGWQPRAP